MEKQEELKQPTLFVGIGASAGGIEAAKFFLSKLPNDSGIAFVLVQHLDPTHESMMSEVLSRYTSLPVQQAAEGVTIEADHLYIIPPGKFLTINGTTLHTHDFEERRGMRSPIDQFFASLAEAHGERAVGIVLSGTASDGTEGLKHIKHNGGLTIAQEPEEAQQAGMPRSAIESGAVDYVLRASEMADLIERYASHPHTTLNEATKDHNLFSKENVEDILALLRVRIRHDFRGYKRNTLVRRINRRMSLKDVRSTKDYADLLRKDPNEVSQLLDDLLIGVTRFFREPEAWDYLTTHVIQPLVANHDTDTPLRVWVPGCSTGQEAFTLAMLLINENEKWQRGLQLQIFATDLDFAAIRTARTGVYPERIEEEIPERFLKRFFQKTGDTYQVRRDVRDMVTFATQNIVSDPPFSNVDLISCRNLMIYLEADVQRRLIALFHFSLRPGGSLFLGNSESIGRRSDLFEPISRKWRLYRRINQIDPTPLPLHDMPRRLRHPNIPVQRTNPAGTSKAPEWLTEHSLAKHFVSAAVLVDAKCHIQHFHGNTEAFLTFPQGEPTHDLLSLVRKGLRSRVRAAVHDANENNQAITFEAPAQQGDSAQPTRVTVLPTADAGLFVVAFEKQGKPVEVKAHQTAADDAVIQNLEDELRGTREELQNSIEELETSNEELKASNEETMSMNEELQSTNEELETSKEELQSVNEELVTLNTQLKEKIDELETLNDDLDNLINSTDIATLFLSPDLHVKGFTPPATELLNLIGSDIGRPLSDLASKVSSEHLEADAKAVIELAKSVGREVQSDDGRWFIRRALPYRTSRNTIEGVVITFSDVTDLKNLTTQVQQSEQLTHDIIENSPVGMHLFQLDGDDLRIIEANPAADRIMGIPHSSYLGKTIEEALPNLAKLEIVDLYKTLAREGGEIHREIEYNDADVTRIFDVHNFRPSPNRVVSFFREITDERQAADRLIRSEERLRRAKAAADLGIHDYDPVNDHVEWDERVRELWGADKDEPINYKVFAEGIHPEDLKSTEEALTRALAPNGRGEYRAEYRVINRKTNVLRWVCATGETTFDNGKAVRLVGTVEDITERKNAEHMIAQLNQRLEEKVYDRTDELQRQTERLRRLAWALADAEQKERRRLAKILHDHLQQLLVASKYQLNLAAKHADRQVAEHVEKSLSLIDESINTTRDLTVEISPPVLYDSGITAALHWLAERLKHNHDFRLTVETQVPNQRIPEQSRVLLFDCIRELLLNVIKHSGVKAAHVKVYELQDNKVKAIVSDRGKGFRPASSDGAETGHVGLFQIGQRIDSVGGSFEVDSEPGEGSRMTLICPIGPAAALPERAQAKQPPKPVNHVKNDSEGLINILLTDDHRVVREGLRALLETEADLCVVAEASDGSEAIELAASLNPDLILMDINMDGVDGLEATRTIKAAHPQICIIGLSVHDRSAMEASMKDAGADEFLTKSAAHKEVIKVIRRVLEARKN